MRNLSHSVLKQSVLEAVANYNKYRSPEATAKLVKMGERSFKIEFSGSFCYGCGVGDYFEDFTYELRSIDSRVEANIKWFRQTSHESFLVEFELTDSS